MQITKEIRDYACSYVAAKFIKLNQKVIQDKLTVTKTCRQLHEVIGHVCM